MWELSRDHCCATCFYSHRPESSMETNCQRNSIGASGVEGLFPLAVNLLCAYYRENLRAESVQAVLVRPDGRCEGYECHTERYMALYGAPPAEDEELYSLELLAAYPDPSAGRNYQTGL